MELPANVARSLRVWGAGLATIFSVMAAPADTMSADRSIRFAIIGDRTGGHQPGVYGDIITEINRLRPEFVLTVGDQIEGYVDDETTVERQWSEYDSLAALFEAPLYLVAGNHDIWSDFSAQYYRENVGAPYYSFDRGPLHFIVLDNSRATVAEPFSAEQCAWVAEDLRAHRDAAYTLVFYHQPLWYFTLGRGEADSMHTLFVEQGVDAVFTGHFHRYFAARYDGILYTSLGSSGGGTYPDPAGIDYHFAFVTVDESGIHIAPIRAGAVQPWDLISDQDRRVFEEMSYRALRIDHPLEVDAKLQVASRPLQLTVDNRMGSAAIDDTLLWDVPAGWIVAPSALGVHVPAGETQDYFITARCPGDLYPVPTGHLDFTYKSFLPMTVSQPLLIAREVFARRAAAGVQVDGDLSEAAWAAPAEQLFDAAGSAALSEPVEFYFAYDRMHLYLAVRCDETVMDSLAAEVTERDGAVYGEDCVGYFFEIPPGSGTVYQIYFNPKGIAFDQRITPNDTGGMDAERVWNGEYQVAHRWSERQWVLEVGIPLSQFGAEASPGDAWRLNFRRKQRRLGRNADWQVPIDYHPETFGRLVFVEEG